MSFGNTNSMGFCWAFVMMPLDELQTDEQYATTTEQRLTMTKGESADDALARRGLKMR